MWDISLAAKCLTYVNLNPRSPAMNALGVASSGLNMGVTSHHKNLLITTLVVINESVQWAIGCRSSACRHGDVWISTTQVLERISLYEVHLPSSDSPARMVVKVEEDTRVDCTLIKTGLVINSGTRHWCHWHSSFRFHIQDCNIFV